MIYKETSVLRFMEAEGAMREKPQYKFPYRIVIDAKISEEGAKTFDVPRYHLLFSDN